MFFRTFGAREESHKDMLPILCTTLEAVRWIVPCPAKLNLFLAVGPIDSRGYHPLRTVFQAIDLCDTLDIEIAAKNEVVCDDPSVPKENTLTRTLRLLAEVINIPPLKVTLHKQIPAESGLGGGSSDAAGLIRAAVKIAGLPIPKPELMGLAQTIGADVPFFLCGGRARAEGYGERLVELPDPATEWYGVVRPQVGCETKGAFGRLDAMTYAWRDFPVGDELHNDFERVAPCESLDLIERLQIHGARDAALTGSGSAVFGRFESEESAEQALAKIQGESDARAWKAKNLTRSESLRVIET
jgi:4-diphosphocytidyl-2-C-methyl-D-erythritol kinase